MMKKQLYLAIIRPVVMYEMWVLNGWDDDLAGLVEEKNISEDIQK